MLSKNSFLHTILILMVIVSFLPPFAKPAKAQFGIPGVPQLVIDLPLQAIEAAEETKRTLKQILDGAARIAAQVAIERIVSSTVEWANSGFDGNPAYAVNPQQYFTDIADGVVGGFVGANGDLSFLCSPFQANIRLSLVQEYYEPKPFQCTLTDVIGNIDNFYDDFSQGGWDAWFSMTQNPTNNPYGAYLKAKIELDSQIAQAVGLEEKQLEWNSGFLSYKKCLGTEVQNNQTGKKECIGATQTVTPGVIIKGQLDKVLPAGLEKLINVQHVEQLFEAFAVGVLKKYVFGDEGLFSGGQAIPSGTPIDIDGDSVYDGYDSNGDGQADTCFYGGVSSPSNPPCRGSRDTSLPPYVPPPTSPGGGQCLLTGNKYESVLSSAMNAVLTENPDVAALDPRVNEPRNGREYRVNAIRFLRLTAEKLQSMGYQATEEVLNGNGLPSTGDIIAVWSSDDTEMERYDAIDGNATVMRNAPMTDFTGFIPLNCTLSGGGNDCGCKTSDGGGGETGPGPGSTNPGTPGGPTISAVSPSTVAPGATITITGTNLSSTVRFRSSTGALETIGGATVNSTKTQVTVQVPAGMASGSATVQNIVYNNSSVVSNTFPITIGSGSSGNFTTATPTSTWSPTQTDNGWWPSLSPDGRYVAYGNWGGSFVTDLESSNKQTWDFSNPGDLPSGSRCFAGQWLSNSKLTFFCEIGNTGGSNGFQRYEVTVGEWQAVKTSDNPQLVNNTMFRAEDGHWASYLASPAFRVAKDNQTLATGSGGAISMSGNTLVHACTNSNQNICVREGSVLTKTYPVRTPMHLTATQGGHIVYGGYGPVRGITPTGSDSDLTIFPTRLENPSDVFLVNGARWVSTTAWDSVKTYILLRPWASRSAITIEAPAVSVSVAVKGSNLVVAYNDSYGRLTVLTVPITAPRHQF